MSERLLLFQQGVMNPVKEDPVIAELNEITVDAANSLLRGEIAAVETYGQAIDKFNDEPEVKALREIRADHEFAVRMISDYVHAVPAIAEDSSGGWGAVTKVIQATANFFGEESAIRSLLQGEELGQQAYYAALGDENVFPGFKGLIRDRLLPMVNQHIERLDAIKG